MSQGKISLQVKNRIKEYRLVSAEELSPNDKNPHKHPKSQRNALAAILDEIGIAGALVVYPSQHDGGKLKLIDGHMRASSGVEQWPCLILDVTDEEADLLLATFDPLGSLAQIDAEAQRALDEAVQTNNEAIRAMLDQLSGTVEAEIANLAPGSSDDAADNEGGDRASGKSGATNDSLIPLLLMLGDDEIARFEALREKWGDIDTREAFLRLIELGEEQEDA